MAIRLRIVPLIFLINHATFQGKFVSLVLRHSQMVFKGQLNLRCNQSGVVLSEMALTPYESSTPQNGDWKPQKIRIFIYRYDTIRIILKRHIFLWLSDFRYPLASYHNPNFWCISKNKIRNPQNFQSFFSNSDSPSVLQGMFGHSILIHTFIKPFSP